MSPDEESEVRSDRALVVADPWFTATVRDAEGAPSVPAEAREDLLALKSGAQFVQTQFCMDAGIVRRYVGRLEQAGEIELQEGLLPLARDHQLHLFQPER